MCFLLALTYLANIKKLGNILVLLPIDDRWYITHHQLWIVQNSLQDNLL